MSSGWPPTLTSWPPLPLPTATPQIIPTRFYRMESDQPQPHCNVRQVVRSLMGTNLDIFRDQTTGSLDNFYAMLIEDIIPEVSADVVKGMRTPYDWCNMIDFQDGSGNDTLVLPVKNIVDCQVLFLRVLPSLPWYRFSRFRNIDGTEFVRAGFTEPTDTPPFVAPYNAAAPGNIIDYTGIEDADVLVDTRAHSLIIPPRALLLTANAAVPFASFNMIPGRLNIETHFRFGYPPNAYASGSPLVFDPTTNIVINPNPNPPSTWLWGPDNIDWSSGMPVGLTKSVSRICANRVLRQKWRGTSDGMSSISVDGASESYGNGPYGGDLEAEEEMLQKIIDTYGIQMF